MPLIVVPLAIDIVSIIAVWTSSMTLGLKIVLMAAVIIKFAFQFVGILVERPAWKHSLRLHHSVRSGCCNYGSVYGRVVCICALSCRMLCLLDGGQFQHSTFLRRATVEETSLAKRDEIALYLYIF